MDDEDLSVAAPAGADADRRDADRRGDFGHEGRVDALDDHGERAGRIDRPGVQEDRGTFRGREPLPSQALGAGALREQPHVTHDRNAGIDELGDRFGVRGAALDLDRLGATFLKQPAAGVQKPAEALMGHPERQVGHHQPVLDRAGHRRRVVDHHVQRDSYRVRQSQDHAAQRISDQDEVGAPFGGHPGRGGVVGRQADDGPDPLEGADGPGGGLHVEGTTPAAFACKASGRGS